MDKKAKVLIGVLLVISGLETVFNAATYAMVFDIIEQQKLNLVVVYTVVVILGYILFSGIRHIKDRTINHYVKEEKASIQKKILDNEEQKFKLFEHTGSSDKMSFFQNDLKLFEDNYLRKKFEIISQVIVLLGVLAFSLYSNFLLTVIFSLFAAVPHFVSGFMNKKIQQSTEHWTQATAKANHSLIDLFKNFWTLMVYHATGKEIKSVSEDILKKEAANATMQNTISLAQMFTMMVGYTMMMIPIGIGMYLTISGDLPIATFVAVQYSSSMIINSLLTTVRLKNELQSAKPIKNKIDKELSFVPRSTSSKKLNGHIQSVVFKDVSFSFGETKVLDNFNLTLNGVDKVLLQGESGSGKTTIFKLLTKQLLPDSGTIYINGIDTRELDIEDILQCFGYISQKALVFDDTIEKNITLGHDFSTKEIMKACEMAQIGELIKNTGLDYVIGEDGQNLSGGQLKRLEIARAILFKRKGLLVDEALSSLDKETGRAIVKTLMDLDKLMIDIEHHIAAELTEGYTDVMTLSRS